MTAPSWRYRVKVRRTASWGPEAWKAEVTRKESRPWPTGPVPDPAPRRRRWPSTHGSAVPLDLVDVAVDVGHVFAWTNAGAVRKADRLVRRDERDRARYAAATVLEVPPRGVPGGTMGR